MYYVSYKVLKRYVDYYYASGTHHFSMTNEWFVLELCSGEESKKVVLLANPGWRILGKAIFVVLLVTTI